jgi:predicted Zn-dependent protease
MIQRLLEQNRELSGWRINETATASYELFFVHRKLETVRATDTVSTSVTVYVDHDGKKGDSVFTVSAAMTEADVKQKIETAVRRAKLVFNEPYELPEGGEESAELPSNMKDRNPKELGRQIADAVFAADTVPGGSINACEIFLYRDTARVINSRGIDKTQQKHWVMIEAIPTFTESAESVELYEDHRFTDFDAAKVTAEIARRMAEARDRFTAKKPKVPMEINVLLRPHEITELLSELADDLNYQSAYMHANLHKIGDDLQENGDGDKLTVTMKAQVPGSEASASFDADGAAFTDTSVIRDGVAAANFGSSRFGQYLGVEKPTGNLPCIRAEAGTLTDADMKKAPYLDCASLSGLQLDLYNDYIGGEIRLAYYFDGEKTVPVTGISMSGKLSAALAALRLSDRMVTEGAYEGPQYLLLKGMTVL